MFDLIAALLNFFYEVWPSYGGAIVLLTILIMTVLAPLTIRQTKSMLAMQRLQPEVKRLRAKYGTDRERMNQEMMALYQANGVNPLGGCLPLLVQLPVFLVLYQVLSGLTRRVSSAGVAVGSFGANVDLPDRTFNPAYLGEDTELHNALESATEMNSFGIDLAESARSELSESFTRALPYIALVLVVGFLTWYQQRQISRRQKGGPSPEMPAQTQALMKILPYMLVVTSFFFPAGLVVYYGVSSLFRVGQQAFLTHRVYAKQPETVEIIRPEPEEDGAAGTAGAAPTRAAGGDHGSRRPVSTAPKKRTPPPTATRARTESSTSKRVTPKQAKAKTPAPAAPEESTSRRPRRKR